MLTATSYSKSVLRVAAEEVARVLGATAYFPSYEIITGNYSRGGYYGDDLREVRPEGVQHVMRPLFFKHFAADPAVKEPAQAFTNGARNAVRARTTARIDELFQVACDEGGVGCRNSWGVMAGEEAGEKVFELDAGNAEVCGNADRAGSAAARPEK